MLAVLEDPAIRARAHAVSVPEYHRMIAAGSLPENLELIRGTLVEKMAKSPVHSSVVELLREHLALCLPPGCFVRQEQPLTLWDSEPEPDVAVILGVRRDFVSAHPATAGMLIEVAVTSEAVDRVKLQLYAEAGVRECWLVLAGERVIERHTEPQGAAYQRIERVTFPNALESIVFPGLTLPPAGLFPG